VGICFYVLASAFGASAIVAFAVFVMHYPRSYFIGVVMFICLTGFSALCGWACRKNQF
jgi:hypothetical protein